MSDEKKSILESGGASASSPDKTARIAPGLSAAAPAAKKPLTNTQRVVMAIVSVAAVAIIAVSASFLFAPGEEAFDHADLFKTTQQAPSDEDAAASSEPASDSSEASDEASSDDGTGEAPGVSGQEVSETSEVVQTGTETAVVSHAGDQTASAGASSPSAPAPESNRDVVTITVSVTSATVGNPVSAGPMQFTFERGATALDALVATGLSVNASSSPFGGSYVSASGGLAEDPSKGAWGWKYSVNGVDPQMSSGLYTLSDGDVVAWRYVTDIYG